MQDAWPFADDPDVAVITLWRIIKGAAEIRLVSRGDVDDGMWQFLDGEEATTEDAAVVALQEMVDHDPSLRELGDLPPGWVAWRQDAASAWQRQPQAE